jgi:hypothetical protein
MLAPYVTSDKKPRIMISTLGSAHVSRRLPFAYGPGRPKFTATLPGDCGLKMGATGARVPPMAAEGLGVGGATLTAGCPAVELAPVTPATETPGTPATGAPQLGAGRPFNDALGKDAEVLVDTPGKTAEPAGYVGPCSEADGPESEGNPKPMEAPGEDTEAPTKRPGWSTDTAGPVTDGTEVARVKAVRETVSPGSRLQEGRLCLIPREVKRPWQRGRRQV